MNMEKNKESGITLVALVVTIIVLLILAGITIGLVLNNNGIIQRASDASVIWTNAITNEDAMMETLYSDIATYTEGAPTRTIIKINGTDINTVEDLTTLYGYQTDLVTIEGITWDLFYDDSDNYYLISSDYVPVSTLPSEIIKESGEPTEKYKAWLGTPTSSDSYYGGDILLNEPWSDGATSTTITENPLTNKYLKWVNSSLVRYDYQNMHAVAYMMDTSKWSNFAGDIDGAYAIGGPTIEMFVNSYNAVSSHTTKFNTYGTSASNITSTNGNERGYKVKFGNDNWKYNSCSGLDTSTTESNTWVIISTNKAYAYWISSPSAYDKAYLWMVRSNGNMEGRSVGDSAMGFRPVICIPKS